MKQTAKHNSIIFLAAFLAVVSASDVFGEEGNVSASYLFTLSNFTGILPVSWVDVSIDESRDEVYVLPGKGIKIFNDRAWRSTASTMREKSAARRTLLWTMKEILLLFPARNGRSFVATIGESRSQR